MTQKEPFVNHPFQSLVDFDELKLDANGLIPCITQDYQTGEVLMLAYMNRASLEQTLNTGNMVYYSRSRQKLWKKGEESGHLQFVKELWIDCDKDTILAKVAQIGAACHTGNPTCFFTPLAKQKQGNDEVMEV
jgi:phosphoribosyl-ATP pyrophosphohydrolase/phosphoribosyl-AMP cyclohydrolase